MVVLLTFLVKLGKNKLGWVCGPGSGLLPVKPGNFEKKLSITRIVKIRVFGHNSKCVTIYSKDRLKGSLWARQIGLK